MLTAQNVLTARAKHRYSVRTLNRVGLKSFGLSMQGMDKTLVSWVYPDRKSPQLIWIQAPKSEPALELHSRAASSVEAHQHVSGPKTGRSSGGRRIKKHARYVCSNLAKNYLLFLKNIV